jgi:cyanophycinase
MKRLVGLLMVVLTGAVVVAGSSAPKGQLVLIGGGDKPPEAMRKFIELAGGPSTPIVVIPTASEETDVVEYYTKLFGVDYGCSDVAVLDIKTRDDAARPEFVERTRRARGVFFGGGDQSRITRALLDTPVGDAIAEVFNRGAVIGGTSAGSACQSALMITGEGDFKVIRANSVELVRGLGFFRGVIVDQHFIARQRSNRLISVILEHPDLLGVGIDEQTAVWVRPDDTFEVIGRSSVIVLDASGAKLDRRPGEKGHDLLGVHGLRVDILLPGERYDTEARRVLSNGSGGPS